MHDPISELSSPLLLKLNRHGMDTIYCAFNSATEGYRKSECSSRKSIQRLRNVFPDFLHTDHTSLVSMPSQELHQCTNAPPPFQNGPNSERTHCSVSESPIMVRLRLGRVIATVCPFSWVLETQQCLEGVLTIQSSFFSKKSDLVF